MRGFFLTSRGSGEVERLSVAIEVVANRGGRNRTLPHVGNLAGDRAQFLVFGEFGSIPGDPGASLLLLNTLPVWTVLAGQANGAVATAASMLILIVSWVLLLVMSVLSRRRPRTLRRTR